LNGQYAEHLRLQLELWKAGARGSGDYSQVMQAIAERLTAEDIEAVARYYASLAPTGRREATATGQAASGEQPP